MLNEFIAAYQAGLTACCLFIGLLIIAVAFGFTVGPANMALLARFRKMSPLTKCVVIYSVLGSVAYAGYKFMRAGADERIALVSVIAAYDETNDVTSVEVNFMGHNVTTATPVSVRNDQTESWRELEKIGAIVTTDFATNTLAFAVSGNVSTNAFWWVGTETPAVIIESKGIEITHFAASSRSVEIMWTCDDPNATEYVIERRRKGEAKWETVRVTSSLAFVYVGFTVGETWEWRVSSTYAEVE